MNRTIHQIWLGDPANMPADHARFIDSWKAHHSGWDHKLWTDADAEQFPLYNKLAPKCQSASAKSDVLRWIILHELGGLYVDTDMECLDNTDDLWFGADLVVGQLPSRLCGMEPRFGTGVIYSGHIGTVVAWIHDVLSNSHFGTIGGLIAANYLLEKALVASPSSGTRLLASPVLYPLANAEEQMPNARAIHHWAGSWMPDAMKIDFETRLTQ